jgi:hypothetical protein
LTLDACEIVEIVGESYRQDILRTVAAHASDSSRFLDDLTGYARKRAESVPGRRWFQAALIREPDNPADRNAIAVHASGFGRIGYLSREDAVAYAHVFDELGRQGCSIGACPAFLIGGEPSKPHFGALLCLSPPDAVVSELRRSPSASL